MSRPVVSAGQSSGGSVLVVDDSRVNRRLLEAAVRAEGHRVQSAEDGTRALAILAEATGDEFDVVLLDLVMPGLDGFETLARLKSDAHTRHLPVIVISALDDTDSVARCIEMGATDYLPKPFDRQILHARLNASLVEKRLRDLEREYLEQVEQVMRAAAAVEEDVFEPSSLDPVAARGDALGQLARTFRRMAAQVKAREERLRSELHELRIEIDEARQAARVAEITDSGYFRDLRARADDLRRSARQSSEDRTS